MFFTTSASWEAHFILSQTWEGTVNPCLTSEGTEAQRSEGITQKSLSWEGSPRLEGTV